MPALTDRMVRAVKLDVELYEEVEADTGAMSQAVIVVVLSSLATGIGSIIMRGLNGVIVGAIAALDTGISESHDPHVILANRCWYIV